MCMPLRAGDGRYGAAAEPARELRFAVVLARSLEAAARTGWKHLAAPRTALAGFGSSTPACREPAWSRSWPSSPPGRHPHRGLSASADRRLRARRILQQIERIAGYSRQLLRGGPQGGQPLPGHAVVVTAEQQVGRMRPGVGRWQHDPDRRRGRAAAGGADDGRRRLRPLAGPPRNRCVHAPSVARPGPGQQGRISLMRGPKVPTLVPGLNPGRLSSSAGGSVGSKSDGYRQTTCAGQSQRAQEPRCSRPRWHGQGWPDRTRRSHMSQLSLSCTMVSSSANHPEHLDGYGS